MRQEVLGTLGVCLVLALTLLSGIDPYLSWAENSGKRRKQSMWMKIKPVPKGRARKGDSLQNNTLWTIPLDRVGQGECKRRRLGTYPLGSATACAWQGPYVRFKSSVAADPCLKESRSHLSLSSLEGLLINIQSCIYHSCVPLWSWSLDTFSVSKFQVPFSCPNIVPVLRFDFFLRLLASL